MILRVAWAKYVSNFSSNPGRDAWVYLLLVFAFICYATVACFGEMWIPECNLPPDDRKFQNPLYDSDPCRFVHYPELLLMNREELSHLRRTLLSVLLGSIIGYERRSPDRPAGIRTMSVTALGSCTFTLASMFAFVSGPMAWDASRISASIPSGCGFLGAGIIWKGFVKNEHGGADIHQVHGLTTAASIWMSAAVGVAAGGGMYFVAIFSTLCIVLMLRFGPRMEHADPHHDEHQCDQCGDLKQDPPNTLDPSISVVPSTVGPILCEVPLTEEVVEALGNIITPPHSDIEQPLLTPVSLRSAQVTESMASGDTYSNAELSRPSEAEGARKRTKQKRPVPSMISYN